MVKPNDFKVSVIMPVYNAAAYIERAAESVVHLENTGELLMIDDGSTDDSLAVCKRLEKKYDIIRVLEHRDKKNHGASAARNVGIRNAKYNVISFLDADDYYLPNRFDAEKNIFLSDENIDGVYGCTLAKFESAEAREKFLKGDIAERTTLSQRIPPEKLFHALIRGGYGCFHTSAVTLKKKIFAQSGMFNEKIRYGEDTELWYKMSLVGTLVAGSIEEPVAIRWVHGSNSIHQFEKMEWYRKLMHREVFKWAVTKPFSFEVKNAFFNAIEQTQKKSSLKILLSEVARKPFLLFTSFFYKKLHLLSLQLLKVKDEQHR